MADYPHPSSAGRSANMRANRRADTKPELALRRALHRLGYRYRKDYRLDLDVGRRVRPDIAFTARKVAVFVDGCFWHACPDHGSQPRANQWYWGPKLVKNVERDRVNDAALILAGWTVVRLWEHVPLDEAVTTVVAALTAGSVANTAVRGALADPIGPTETANPSEAPAQAAEAPAQAAEAPAQAPEAPAQAPEAPAQAPEADAACSSEAFGEAAPDRRGRPQRKPASAQDSLS